MPDTEATPGLKALLVLGCLLSCDSLEISAHTWISAHPPLTSILLILLSPISLTLSPRATVLISRNSYNLKIKWEPFCQLLQLFPRCGPSYKNVVLSYTSVCAHLSCACACACTWETTSRGNQFLPSVMCVSGMELRWSREFLHPLSHLAGFSSFLFKSSLTCLSSSHPFKLYLFRSQINRRQSHPLCYTLSIKIRRFLGLS